MPTMSSHLNGGGAALDSEIFAIMEDAYRRVCNSITAPLSVRKVIAEKILELTSGGARDPRALCHDTLAFMHMQGDCE
ncbi:MAG: hypothetical protein ABW198_10465 [Pseudorhodoplanes sp.]